MATFTNPADATAEGDIEVEIPVDIMQPGSDPDGLPRTEPTPQAAAPAPAPAPTAEAEAEPAPIAPARERESPRITLAELEAERRKTAALLRERDQIAQFAVQERDARAIAERELRDRTAQALRAHWDAVHSDHQHIVGAINATKAEMDAAERELAAAVEASDSARIAEANKRLAKAASFETQLEDRRAKAESRIERAKQIIEEEHNRSQAQAAQRERPQAQAQPEAPASQGQPQTPDDWIAQFPRRTTGAWLSANKDYVTDPAKHRDLLAFANDWVADYGQHTLHTTEFVKALNQKFLGVEAESEAEVEATAPPVATPAKRKPPLASASVTHAATPTRSATASDNKVTLSPMERAQAVQMYHNLPAQQAIAKYAANKLQAERDGKYASRS